MIRIDYLPKIGDRGLAIFENYHVENWRFAKCVAQYMRRNNITECWFQTFNVNGEWNWMHGIVTLRNGKAIITQIG